MAEEQLVNRVAASGLKTLKLETFYPEWETVELDLKDYLFKGMILREKDFREAMKNYTWEALAGKDLLVFCSTDAIIPMWAYMLVTAHATPFAHAVYQVRPQEYLREAFLRRLADFDGAAYAGERVIVKGCSDRPVPAAAFTELTRRLRPYARTIMYGEPCSTVPIYKAPKKK